MSSSPISSVPEPSSSAGGGLASVITQVSPNAPTSTRNSGPARPQKVKTSTSASKKKKKSSTTTGAGGTTSNTTSAPTGETTTTTEGKEGTGKADDSELEKVANAAKAHANAQAEAQATGSSINPSPAGVVSGLSSQETVTLGDGKAGEKDGANGGNSTTLEQQASSHAADPSSTVVGDVSNATSSSNSANTNKENVTAPVVSNQVPSKSKTSTPAPAIQKNAAKTSSAPQQQAPTSPMKKLIALLTCSSSAGGIVASEKKEDEKEKRNASGTDGAKSNVSGNDSKKVVNEKQNGNATPKVSSIPATNSPSTPSKAKKSKKSSTALAAGAGAGLAAGGLVATSTSSNNLAPPRTPNTPRRSLEGAISGSSTPKRGSMILGGGDDEVSANTTPGGGTRIPREETGDVMSAAVVPPGSSFVSEGDTQDISTSSTGLGVSNLDEEGSEEESDEEEFDEEEDEERRLIMQGGIGIPVDENGNPMPLLSELGKQDTGRKCLVLDLDETLVHSSFKAIQNADFIVPVEIEGTTHSVFVIKRPGVDEFMRKMGEIYEVVVFTASLSKYADPVLDILDIHKVVRHRLFRESCYNHKGNYVKDLSQLGRPISESIIIDNSPASYIFHPNNAVPVSSWFNDPHDTELTDLCPFLSDLATTGDVRAVLDGGL